MLSPQWTFAGRRIGSYRACGYVGLLAAISWVTTLTLARRSSGLTLLDPLLVTLASVAAFLFLVKASVVVFGHERIVFYEAALAAVAASALALRLADRPLGAGLDLATLGIFVFLVSGRCGCYWVGCCHGRPARRGVRYGHEHSAAGFPTFLVAVPLFPIQLLESALVFVLVLAGTILALLPHRPGEVAACLFAFYGVVRSLLELYRGDTARPVWLGVSEAQWLALIVACALVWLGRGGALAWLPAYLATALALTSLCAGLILGQQSLAWTHWGLGAPAHLQELSVLLAGAVAVDTLTVFTTSRGARVSCSREGTQHHFALSRADRPISDQEVRALADWICRLRGRDGAVRPGVTPGLYHLYVDI